MAPRPKSDFIAPPPDEDNEGGVIIYAPFGGKQVNTMTIGRPRTRPHPTDPGVAERIGERIIMGHGVHSFLDDPDNKFPSRREYYRELARNPFGDFANIIARARMEAHHAIMDHCHHLAMTITEDNVASRRETINWFKWHQARLHPRKYGDKLLIGDDARPTDVTLDREEFTDIAFRLVEEY
jgi:hypothetical protein